MTEYRVALIKYDNRELHNFCQHITSKIFNVSTEFRAKTRIDKILLRFLAIEPSTFFWFSCVPNNEIPFYLILCHFISFVNLSADDNRE